MGPRTDQLTIYNTTRLFPQQSKNKNSKNEQSASHDIDVPDHPKRLTIEGNWLENVLFHKRVFLAQWMSNAQQSLSSIAFSPRIETNLARSSSTVGDCYVQSWTESQASPSCPCIAIKGKAYAGVNGTEAYDGGKSPDGSIDVDCDLAK
jgi:hypothetical protein